jgi:hypothetical protein
MRRPLDILYNFHWVVPGEAARASQAHFGLLGPFLRRHGIRALINLRGENRDLSWWRYETGVVDRLGAAHFDVMLDSRRLPTRAMLAGLFDAFDAAPRPFVLKCSGGQDRSSFAAALFLLHRNGWGARALADRQFDRFPYLHFPKRHQRWLKPFIAFSEADAAGRPIAEWVRTAYQPERLEAWLSANGYSDSFAGLFTMPTRSRWQW